MDRGHRLRIERSPTWTIVLAARRDASGIAALSLRNRRRRGARRRPPAAAPSTAAGIAACGGRAARALLAPRARQDPLHDLHSALAFLLTSSPGIAASWAL